MKKHKNIAVFIPHLGCPNACVFCSQTKITGVCETAGDIAAELERVDRTISEAVATLGDSEAEIAFFGGSFTGIGEERMTALLDCAGKYLGGSVKGIRCSTRPDYVNQHICDILKSRGVTSVELGIQSTDNAVLAASKRGHDAEAGKRACALIKANGFELGGQMMVGLPLSTPESELQTARDIVSYGADCCRIYPCVVFTGTPLYAMAQSGEYTPLTNEDGAARAAACARVFIENGVRILRIGLHASENLKEAPFGANHPAIGELAESEIYFGIIGDALRAVADGTICSGVHVTVGIPVGELSKCIGQGRKNKTRLENVFAVRLVFEEDKSIQKYSVRIKDIETQSD